MTKAYSPDWIARKISDFRNKIEEAVSRAFAPSKLSLFIWLSVGIFAVAFFTQFYNGPMDFVLHKKWIKFLCLVIAIMFFCRIFNPSRINFNFARFMLVSGIVTTVSFMAFAMIAGEARSYFIVLVLVIGTRVLLEGCFYFFKNQSLRRKIVFALFAAVSVLNVFSYFSNGWFEFAVLEYMRSERLLYLIYIPLLEFGTVSELSWAEAQRLFRTQLWFPLQLIYPIPTRLHYWLPAPNKMRMQIRGYFDVVVGFSYLFLYTRMSEVHFAKYSLPNVWRVFQYGTFVYIETYFLSCGLISIVVGSARLFSFNMPDPCSMALLAASPFERWRRWNLYFFNFLRWSVFIPFLKKTSSPFVAVMMTFLATSLFHSFGSHPFVFIAPQVKYFAVNGTAFFMAHGLAVYLSLKYKLQIFDGARLRGWLGVAVTWIMMIGIHLLNRWVE